MKNIFTTLLFVFLSSLILTFYSEVSYWYNHWISIIIPTLFYSVAAHFFLYTVQKFNINNFYSLFLAWSIYWFIVEWVIAPVLYEDWLFWWFNTSYTPLAWHALISVMIWWFHLRRLMLQKRILVLSLWSIWYGLLWWVWAMQSWMEEWNQIYTTIEFTLYAFFIWISLMISYWLIWKVWKEKLYFNKYITGLFILVWLFLYIPHFLIYNYSIIKWIILIWLVIFLLNKYKSKSNEWENIIKTLAWEISPVIVLPIILMPITATVIYAIIYSFYPISLDIFKDIPYTLIVLIQTALGWIFFILSIYKVSSSKVEPIKLDN